MTGTVRPSAEARRSFPHMAATSLAAIIDSLALLLLFLLAFILVTGGGRYDLLGVRVSVRTVANPLLALHAVLLIRYSASKEVPLFGRARLTPARIATWSLHLCQGVSTALARMPVRRAATTVLLIIAVTTLVKLANAAFYPGFFSGDDVEIHEMTFVSLFGMDWPVWDLRSPFYPMTVIYPVQRLAVWAGVTETQPLVFLGRAVVAVLSSIAVWLIYKAGAALDDPGTGLLAAATFAIQRLHVVFGGSELPRPVSTIFVAGAFVCLLQRSPRASGALTAGALLAVGGCLRYSELVFILPAVVVLAIDRRRRDILSMLCAFALTAGAILAISDAVYWGEPFFSLRNILRYTLVDRLSSRGYEPLLHYLAALPSWTSIPVALLAAYGAWLGNWRPAVWWLLPLILLSLLPHKEPRYLIPLLPFVSLNAAQGLREVLRSLREDAGFVRRIEKDTVALALVVLCAGAVIFEVGGWRFLKETEPLTVARYVHDQGCRRAVGIEQAWRAGGQLYLRSCRVVDVYAPAADRARLLPEWIEKPDFQWVVLREPISDQLRRDLLESGSFREVDVPGAPSHFVMRR